MAGGWIKKNYYKMLRKLEKEDYYKEFMELINYFTRYKQHITYDNFEQVFEINEGNIILVIEKNNRIIGTGKLMIEKKFHNNLSNMGHIEDIIVLEEYRKKGYGKLIIEELIRFGKENNCYKLVLNCNAENIEYYKKINFIEKGYEMCLYA